MASAQERLKRVPDNDDESLHHSWHRMVEEDRSEDENREIEESAASRVFAIPELLEMILAQHGRRYCSSRPILYPLRRVNSTFAATMQHSPSLRHLMYLDSGPDSESPIVWFLSHLWMYHHSEHLHKHPDSDLDEINRFPSRHRGRLPRIYSSTRLFQGIEGSGWGLSKKWTAEKNATWRSLKVFNGAGPNVGYIRLSFFSHDFDARLNGKPSFLENLLVFTPEGDPTLGDVYEEFRETVLLGLELEKLEVERRLLSHAEKR